MVPEAAWIGATGPGIVFWGVGPVDLNASQRARHEVWVGPYNISENAVCPR